MHKRTLAFLFLHPLGPHVTMSQFLGVHSNVAELTNFAVFLTNFRCSLPIIRINFAAENKRYSRL